MSEPVEHARSAPPGEAADPEHPRVLSGRYLLEERVASGGMASVWRAHDELLARTVAVKILHDHLAADDGFRERFRREAISAAKLTHPNVVSLYDTGKDGDRVFLVMEFIDGSTLKDIVSERRRLSVSEVALIGAQVARALDYAHARGLVHRDVKPANILIGADGAVKVTDFGIAKADHADDLTKTGMVLGTAAYVAPEQLRGEPVDGKADQYALAVVLYEALTGIQPFKGDTPVATAAQRLERSPRPVRSMRPDVPRGLDAALARAMAREPADRFRSAGALAEALEAFADDEEAETAALAVTPERPAPAPAGGGHESFLRSEGRFLVPVVVLLAVAAVLVGVGLWTGVLETRDGFPVGIARQDEDRSEGDSEITLINPAAVSILDPGGSGRERDQDLGNLLDGDPSTTWRTEHYNSPPFGGLKDGVGFYLDLGQPHALSGLALRTVTPGAQVQIRVADKPAPTADGWQLLHEFTGEEELLEVRFSEDVTTRYVLVWITGALPPSPHQSGRFAAEFSQIAISGASAG